MAKDTFHTLDMEELAAYLCGLSEEDDYDQTELDEQLIDKYALDSHHFHLLIDDLSPLLDMAISPLTEEPFIGFGDGKMWIAKRSFPTFINQVLIWMSAEQIKSGEGRAYEREIHSKGKPEFKLVLMKADQDYELIDKKEVANG